MKPLSSARALLVLLVAGAASISTAAPLTYRGSLHDQGRPAEGDYDFRFSLVDASGRPAAVEPITAYAVEVRAGQFATELDFGIDAAASSGLSLQTEIARDGDFVVLGSPLAFQSQGVAPGACWSTLGNAGTSDATDFLGTTDAQSLHLRVNNQDFAEFKHSGFGVNIRLGSVLNSWSALTDSSVVLGGGTLPNTGNGAIGTHAAVLGGYANVAESGGTVAGGHNNHAAQEAFVAGSFICAGGHNSFGLGRNVRIRRSLTPGATPITDPCNSQPNSGDADGDNGTFAWADDQPVEFESTGLRQFLVRAGGGVMLNSNALVQPGDDLVLKARGDGDSDSDLRMVTATGKSGLLYLRQTDGSWRFAAPNLSGADFLVMGNNARLTAGGTWTNASSRTFKHEFAAVDARAVLDGVLRLPLSTWQYRASPEGRHMGPVAEDFHAAFGLGGSSEAISTVDADGVALAAIQGLHQQLLETASELSADNAVLRRQNDELLQRMAAIELRAGLAP